MVHSVLCRNFTSMFTYQRGEVDDCRRRGVDLQGLVAEGLGRVGRLVADVIAEQRAVAQIRRRRLKETRDRPTEMAG